MAGFLAGEYGVVALSPFPNQEGRLPPDNGPLPPPTLGELFTPAVPLAAVVAEPIVPPGREQPKGKAAALGGHLGGLGSVMSLSGLSTSFAAIGGGKKVDKNGVVAVPRTVGGKGKQVMKGELEGDGDWLRGREWGWEEDGEQAEGEVLAVRGEVLIPLNSSGKARGAGGAEEGPSAVAYDSTVDETLVCPPYIISLLAPPAPPQPPAAHHGATPTPPASAEASSPPQLISARLLTAASSTGQPPILFLASAAPPPGSAPTPSSSASAEHWSGSRQRS